MPLCSKGTTSVKISSAETEETLLDRLYTRFHGSKTLLFISHRDAISARADSILRI